MSLLRVCAEINLKNIEHNLNMIHDGIGADCKIILVIKADGYGHGAVKIARFCESREDIYGYAVATSEEAFELRDNGISKPVLILGYTFPDDYEKLIQQDIILTVFCEDSLDLLEKAAYKTGKKAKVHVKVDTGMSRIGIRPDNKGMAFINKLISCQMLEFDGIFTHFASADEREKETANTQLELFDDFINAVEKKFCITIPMKHCANSAAILRMPRSHMNAVRAGIISYGLQPSSEMAEETKKFRPALSLYSSIIYIKEIPAGTAISYGGTFVAEHAMRIATVPVGYGDGYPRSLSNKGYVLIREQKARILGRICMDQFMVDVSHIPQAQQGDKVTLIGRDHSLEITAEELGDLSGRFNYELACNLGKRISRMFIC